jgi:hypothetical protein
MYAERNRNLKKLLEAAFGRGKVTVKGSRGTASGWVTVKIAYAPRDEDERRELNAKVWQIIKAGKVEIGTYGYNDPGSDYGHGSTIHIGFEQCRDIFDPGERVTYCDQIGTVRERDYGHGGNWYTVTLDNGVTKTECYKGDLVRVAA